MLLEVFWLFYALQFSIFKPVLVHAWFLENAFVWEVSMRVRVCVCVRIQAIKNHSCEMKTE